MVKDAMESVYKRLHHILPPIHTCTHTCICTYTVHQAIFLWDRSYCS